jgi:uncharacterized protein
MIHFIFSLPAFVKVGCCFFGMMGLYEAGIPLGFAILLWGALLTVWSGAGIEGFYFQVHNLLMPENYMLLVAIFLLLFFTEALDASGRMKRTIKALSDWFKSKKMLIAGLPALIGLLPMPGGAIFSAPLVASVDSQNNLKPQLKAAINYWFRHLWEYWWPLYPGVLLSIKYAGIPAGLFYLVQMPFSVAAITGGYFFILNHVPNDRLSDVAGKRILDRAAAASTLVPIGFLVFISITGSMLLPYSGITGELANFLSMTAGLVLSLFLVLYKNMPAFKKSLGLLKRKNTWYMMALILGIQVFSTILKCPIGSSENHTLVFQMQNEFTQLGIPLILVIALIPFISGVVTGVAFGFVGASFPIVFALLGQDPDLHVRIAATTFAYGCGYFGMILSPMHVCFVVTNEYFNSRLFQVYRYILIPAICVFASCIVCSSIYYFLL